MTAKPAALHQTRIGRRCRALVFVILGLISAQPCRCAPAPNPAAKDSETVILPKSVPDPFEPFNRGLWAFNRGLMSGVVKPTAKVYRVVVRKPIRTGVKNFGRNITYPGRLFNNLLEGKWSGARDETYRFACNTVVG